jgi:uncharacterized membrane protein HdeD (DUF308 family)
MSTQVTETPAVTPLEQELGHLKSSWCWFFWFGILLVLCGTAALVFPALTLLFSIAAVAILGVVLLVAGVATIVHSFWAGKWSGTLLQLLVGILYIVAGFTITDRPIVSTVTMTAFVAAFFIVVGAFRTLAAFIVRFPRWGWAALNGVVTFLLGVIIYRHFPESAIWVIGVLVGVEMLFHGWMWIMLGLALRNLPDRTPAAANVAAT